MKRNIFRIVILVSLCLPLIGCGMLAYKHGKDNNNRPNIESIIDYSDWYYDIDNKDTYNYVKWIELDIWFCESVDCYDWSDISFDVLYNDNTIASDLDIIVSSNYIRCYFDVFKNGAILTDTGYLAPGDYEFLLKDATGKVIESSNCVVRVESGETLSSMMVRTEQINNQTNSSVLRVFFNGDITPYTKTGFYIMITHEDSGFSYIPESYSIELADTYMTVRYCKTGNSLQGESLSIYCGDGTFVCSVKTQG